MTPATGEHLLRFVGDKILFTLRAETQSAPKNLRAFLRTNLGRAAELRREIISAHAGNAVAANSSWRDLPMQKTDDGWQIELPLAEVGFFKSKPYLLDEKNWQHWPDGSDVGISVHPNFARTANTIYCAFTRLFGATKNLASTADGKLEAQLKSLEALGYATLPPSGKFRDLAKQLPHIVQKLGCRILHLLPVHPTPTTYARFGRFGSPYAALDLTAVDPALVEFDKRATGIDQFCELTYAAHSLGARVFIDIVINHTGWGSTLQENRPEFFLKNLDGSFASPGAWGTVWEDLVELEQHDVKLWDIIADSLIIWCKRGVDGFRCDAGYKIPVPAWQYIIARVQEEFPETIFLLEGLGGAWEATENLLTGGGMQWAYSELFQNYSGADVAKYLDYSNRQSARIGGYVHYSETHDNSRLAAYSSAGVSPAVSPSGEKINNLGRAWSLLRNRLCALTSPSGGFGFTCGVEWLAAEKIRVHGNTGLNWDSADNIVPELAQLNQLISNNPCFFDGAKLTRLSAPDSPIYALLRESAEGKDSVLVLVNTDVEKSHLLTLAPADLTCEISDFQFDLLGQPLSQFDREKTEIIFTLAPGACHCLAQTQKPAGLSGENYRRARAQAAFAIQALSKIVFTETIDSLDWRWLAEQVESSPENFLAAAGEFAARETKTPLADLLRETEAGKIFPRIVMWTLIDARRVTLVPPGHWLLIEDSAPFRAELRSQNENAATIHVQSIAAGTRHIACFAPRGSATETELFLERYAVASQKISAAIRFLAPEPAIPTSISQLPSPDSLVLLTNGIGGMARLCVDLGRVNSKYDCVLGANLNPTVPVDRHVFVKRIRVWVNADGFLSPLDFKNFASFNAASPAVWNFVANAGDGRTVEIELRAEMLEGKNATVFHFSRPTEKLASGKQLPAGADVRLTVRVDIEDRNFHSETKRNDGADFHFSSNCREIQNSKLKTENCAGFEFTPAPDRQLQVFSDTGEYHPQPEWCENIPHPVEQTRGQTGSGDAYSPGWFEIPLAKGADATLVLTAESGEIKSGKRKAKSENSENNFAAKLELAAKQFVVRRDEGKTVIAGYPWFLDWGRDSLICARGLLAAGMIDKVKQLLLTFAKFEKDGTLPNTIHGNDVSNRDTTDAPLWFAIGCEEISENSKRFYDARVNESGRTIFDVLKSIAENYARGTPNGIRMDSDSALIWSPSHFTWMDTNYPAGTPREGYPVEIQVLWIRLLRQLEKIAGVQASACSEDTLKRELQQKKWRDLADHATASFEKLFWLEDKGWFADVLIAKSNVIARDATASDALRSNCLFAVSLGLISSERAKRCVAAAQKYLVVPGGLRSLAPLPVSVPLPIFSNDGKIINDPPNPYWPRYEGDEDTRRKPAYHNGTAWTWTFPVFCEALARAWDFSPAAVAAAKSYLGSSEKILNEGCLGQIPEILDGDAPHTPRGCDAQAWGVTENLRVWKLLSEK
jgi:starch synthase (maltosyl-transferring)